MLTQANAASRQIHRETEPAARQVRRRRYLKFYLSFSPGGKPHLLLQLFGLPSARKHQLDPDFYRITQRIMHLDLIHNPAARDPHPMVGLDSGRKAFAARIQRIQGEQIPVQ